MHEHPSPTDMNLFYAGDPIVIGFQQTLYPVAEDAGPVTVCAAVLSGQIGNRTFTVAYTTSEDSAQGETS